ncbi:MAG: efflux RND transporter permease subunit, partial [Desulfovibrionaceae bacterium]
AAELVRDDLLQDPDITQVELDGIRDHEIHVEIPRANLRRHGLTLGDIAARIAKASVEQGGGNVRTDSGDILLRMDDRRDSAREYGSVPLLVADDGGRLLVRDVAAVSEGFEDKHDWASFDGRPAVMIDVFRVGEQTPVQVADAAKKVVERLNHTLPEGLALDIVRDRSSIFSERADLLLRNAYLGLALVFVFLALFLEIRLAFWVSLGIPISFLGSFLFLSFTDFSINMITMFAFIVTLGIVVDDAIIVGENVFSHRRRGKKPLRAAVDGVREVAMPVTFSVLTNIVAFMPLFFLPGIMGKVFHYIPSVVICVFAVSLIESLFVLPAHLAHVKDTQPPWILRGVVRLQARFSDAFERFLHKRFKPFLAFTLRHRYSVLAFGLAILLATVGYVKSGRMGMVLFPKVDADYAYVEAALPAGSSEARIRAAERTLIQAAQEVVRENGGQALSEGVFSVVDETTIKIRLFLTPAEVRPLGTGRVTDLWRERTGPLAGLESLSFESDRGGPGSGKGLTVRLSHRDKDVLELAGRELGAELRDFGNVHDIDDGSASGKRQYDIQLLPAGERMELTSKAVADQVRHAFHGAEALRQQRGRNEVTVLVRLPEEERASEATLEDLVIRGPAGGEILLRDAARIIPGKAYTSISHNDGRRVVSVTANVRPHQQAEQVVSALKAETLPRLTARHPGLTCSFEGRQADLRDSVQSLFTGLLLALVAIFALLAVPFRSYVQPLIIMFCIPFGIVGAVIGHLLMGYSLSVMSLFGVVALAGVLVNDSLVLIDFANRKRKKVTPLQAIIESGVQRFRPILLTTCTTFGGLAPMIFETSRQARFLIPMAISLGFGILFTTLVMLVLVPSLYMILEDVWGLFAKPPETSGSSAPREAAPEPNRQAEP